MTADERDSRPFREQSLAFFAKVVPGQGHEITNVLNVVNELTGLMQDLLGAVERGRELDIKRLGSVGDKIQHQVQRGENIVRQVRYFAHNADVPISVFDLKTVLKQIVFLAERHTRLHKSELVSDFPDESVALERSPFELQQAVFVAIESALLTSTLPERIIVGYRTDETHALLFIKSEVVFTGEPKPTERVAFLSELLSVLEGDLVEEPRPGQPFAISFRVSRP